jgi:NAD(P)-dependent dehydrogenase (short-subunit alcohol dehydrogenase family)
MGRFTNKIVVITGGKSGIGLAAARQFITEGATFGSVAETTGRGFRCQPEPTRR